MVPALGPCVLHGMEVVDAYDRPGEVSPEAPFTVPLGALGAGGPVELVGVILVPSLFIFPLLFLIPFLFYPLLAFDAKLVFGEARLGRPHPPWGMHALWALIGGCRCRVGVAPLLLLSDDVVGGFGRNRVVSSLQLSLPSKGSWSDEPTRMRSTHLVGCCIVCCNEK